MSARSYVLRTWQLYALSAILTTGGIAALVGVDLNPTQPPPPSHVSAPVVTPTVTQSPEPTVTHRRPTATAKPTPKVTVTVTPTATHRPTATPTPSVSVSPSESVPPFLLNIDTGTDPGWRVADAATVWNTLTGCDLFTLTNDGRDRTPYDVIQVSQVSGLTMGEDDPADGVDADDKVWGLFSAGAPSSLQLNPDPGIAELIVMHELGHALGLEHSDDPAGVMNPRRYDQTRPSAAEVTSVKKLQKDRCRP